VRAHAHGPQAGLHIGHELAFDQDDVAGDQRQNRDDGDATEQRRPVELQKLDRRLHDGAH